tara:strand:+ start:213 stop:812 length:600 start_codon:yes stop_codon:yes gene_type:complete
MDPLTIALIGGGISALGSVAGGLLQKKKPRQSKLEKQKGQLVDDLLASLKGGGQYSDLFNMDDAAFQKAFVDPAKSRFNNQIAPQIQQSYIASGQQRGTGLDDTLTRAGVDMDQLLNQEYMKYQQGAQNNQMNTLNSILNSSGGQQPGYTTGEQLREGAAGYLTGGGFESNMNSILQAYNQKPNAPQPYTGGQRRKGYA